MGPLLQAVLVALSAGAFGSFITALFTTRDKRYDQLQEDLAAERKQRQEDVAAERKERQDAVARIHELLGITHIQSDYIGELRQHIFDDKGPPPPEWPEGIGA